MHDYVHVKHPETIIVKKKIFIFYFVNAWPYLSICFFFLTPFCPINALSYFLQISSGFISLMPEGAPIQY